MTVKMNLLINLNNFFESIKDSKVSMKTAYKFSKLTSEIGKELEFYNNKMTEIISLYSKKDEFGNMIYSEDGSSIEIVDGKTQECLEKITELQNIDVNLPDIVFSLDELDGLQLTISQMGVLFPFIEKDI